MREAKRGAIATGAGSRPAFGSRAFRQLVECLADEAVYDVVPLP